MRSIAFGGILVGLLVMSSGAFADESVPKANATIPVEIKGRQARPRAVVEVARIKASVALAPIRQRFVERIEKPVYTEAF